MPDRKKLLQDFYAKYAPNEQLTDERLAAIDAKYKDNDKQLLQDFYAKYAPEQKLTDERYNAITAKYGLGKQPASPSGNGGASSGAQSTPPVTPSTPSGASDPTQQEIDRLQAKYENALKTNNNWLTDEENQKLISLKKQKQGGGSLGSAAPMQEEFDLRKVDIGMPTEERAPKFAVPPTTNIKAQVYGSIAPNAKTSLNLAELETRLSKETAKVPEGTTSVDLIGLKNEIEGKYGLLESDYLAFLESTDKSRYDNYTSRLSTIKEKGEATTDDQRFLREFRNEALNIRLEADKQKVEKIKRQADLPAYQVQSDLIREEAKKLNAEYKSYFNEDGTPKSPLAQEKANAVSNRINALGERQKLVQEKTGVTDDVIAELDNAYDSLAQGEVLQKGWDVFADLTAEERKNKEDEAIRKQVAETGSPIAKSALMLMSFTDAIGSGVVSMIETPKVIADALGYGAEAGWTDYLYDVSRDLNNKAAGRLTPLESENTLMNIGDIFAKGAGNVVLFASGGEAVGAIKAGSAIMKNAGVVTSAFLMSEGQNYREALAAGVSTEDAAQYATMISTAQALTETLVPDFKYFDAGTRKSILAAIKEGKGVKEAFKQYGKQLLVDVPKTGIKEVGEELVTEVTGDAIKEGINAYKDATIYKDTFNPETYANVALTAFVTGGGLASLKRGVRELTPNEESVARMVGENADAIVENIVTTQPEEGVKIGEDVASLKEMVTGLKNIPSYEKLGEREKDFVVNKLMQKRDLEESMRMVGVKDDATKAEIEKIESDINAVYNGKKVGEEYSIEDAPEKLNVGDTVVFGKPEQNIVEETPTVKSTQEDTELVAKYRNQEQDELAKAIPNIADFDTYGEKQGNMPNDLYAIYKPIYDKYNELITNVGKPSTTTQESSVVGGDVELEQQVSDLNKMLDKQKAGVINYGERNSKDITGTETSTIDTKEYNELSKEIKKSGVVPILIDKKTGVVIDGNHRLAILKKMGVKNIPVLELDGDFFPETTKGDNARMEFLSEYSDNTPLVKVEQSLKDTQEGIKEGAVEEIVPDKVQEVAQEPLSEITQSVEQIEQPQEGVGEDLEVTVENNGVIKQNKIEGGFLNEKQSAELQKEIESKYNIDGPKFGPENEDIRTNIYTYDTPLAEKNVNGVNLRIAEGLLEKDKSGKKRSTYLLYADGKIAGKFYSVDDIKKVVKFIEDNLIKGIGEEKAISQPQESVGEEATKQQIENFGVNKADVEPVHSVVSQVFNGLKKAGLTAAKTVGDWVGIGKGEANPNSLDGIVEEIQKTLPKIEKVKEQPKTESEIPTWIAEFERSKNENDLVKMEELYNKIKVVQNGVLQGRIKDPIVLEKTIKELNDLKKQIEDYAENWKKENQPKVSAVTETDTKKQPINKIEDLQDVGEKIGGAKKDLAQKLSEVTTEDLATKPLSKVFPKPDFKKLVEEGSLSEDGAILLNFLYEKIPAKPRKQYRVANWVNTVDGALQTTRQVLEAESTKNLDFTDKILKAVTLSETLKRDYKLYSDTMKGLGFPTEQVNLGSYQIKKFENNTKWNKETGKLEPVEGTVYSIVNGSSIVGDFKTMDAAINGLKTILNKTEEKTKGTKFDIYQDRKTKEFFIGKKGAIDVVRVMQGFKTIGEARNFLKEKQADLQGLWDAMKAPKERRMANRPRVGADWRKGKNVDSKEFADTFGFRGVEFGNWVNNAERQSHVNEAYDALMDLSSVLGVSPKALSLNGELGFAFGARGSGKANAHYEAGKVVINLTKTRGAGSLAHEWWHAMDNYFSRNRGQKESFITQNTLDRIERDGTRNQGVRKEMIDAFKSVMDAIKGTKLSERSKVLDRARSDAYWSTNIEMSARSFENYIIEKLGERNQQNDYLANFKETAEWINDTKGDIDALKNYPYPLAEESPIVNEKFQQFFETIKEDENSKLFKDAEAQYRIESGKNIVEAIKDFNGSPRAVVAITHEIMHPTVVAIIDGAKEGNEVGLKHTQTIVDEFNKANPKNQVTVEQLIEGNDAFKDGTTSKKYRAVQEFIAKSWEKYHLEGKQGFSKAFQDVLDQITKAFQSVYKSLSGKQLTPELRKMFDEILGKETTQAQETETQDEVQSFADEIAEETDDEAKNRRINEIAAEYLDAQGTAKYTPKQQAIYDIGLGTNAESFAEFGDRNLITIGLARAYFSKKGMGIDEIALYASNDSGLDITPDDVVDFMLEYPNGLNSRSPRAYDLAMEYKDLTGKNLTTTVAKSILKKAAKGEKVSGGAQKLIEDSYGAFRMTGIVNENNELDLDKLAEIIDDEGYFTQFPLGLTKDEYEKLKEHVKANVLRNEGESLPKLDGEVEAITQEPATEEVAILEVFDTIENAQRTKKTVKGKKEAMEEAVKEYGEVGEKAIFVESNFKDIIESLKEVKDAKGNNILKVKC